MVASCVKLNILLYWQIINVIRVIFYMNLIVVSNLTCDEGLYFRYITMLAKTDLDYDVVIESEKQEIDKYYNMLRAKGWYDFVDDFVLPEWRIEGVRLDNEMNFPMTVKVNKIDALGVPNILGHLKYFRKL